MSDYWRFYCFDYLRYVEIRPLLRRATSATELTDLADSEEAAATIDALTDGEIDVAAARHLLIRNCCCLEEEILFDAGLVRFIARIAANRDLEHVSNMLSEIVFGQRNVEHWLMGATGLTGFLTPMETLELSASFPLATFRPRRPSGLPAFARSVKSVWRRLVDSGMSLDDTVVLLNSLIETAVQSECGIAVYAC